MDNEIRLNKRGFFNLCKDVKKCDSHKRVRIQKKAVAEGKGIIGSPHL